jgi:hypothetical protein
MKGNKKCSFFVALLSFQYSKHIRHPVMVLWGINSFFSFLTTIMLPFLGTT